MTGRPGFARPAPPSPRPSPGARRSGFSFQEILIAVVLIALAAIPSINLIFHFRTYTLHTEDVILALQLANEKMEEYKHMSFRELAQFDGNQENGPVAGQENPLGFSYGDPMYRKFKRKVHIKTAADGDKDKVLITVHVWWHDKMFDFSDGRYVRIAALKTNENFF